MGKGTSHTEKAANLILSNCHRTLSTSNRTPLGLLGQETIPWACLWVSTASVLCTCLFSNWEVPIWLDFWAEVTVVTLVLGLEVGLLDTLERSWVEKVQKRFASNHHLACLPGSPLIVIPRYPHKEISNYTSSYLNKGAPSLHTLPLSPRGKWGAWQLGKQADFLALEFQRPSLFGPSPGASSSSQHPDPEAQNPHVPQLEWALQSGSPQSHPSVKIS